MGKETAIAWTDHTFNPVWGCMKVGPGCDFCYAEVWAARTGHHVWGQDATYREFGDKHWNEPLKWNKRAAEFRVRRRVFCASMADVFDKRWRKGIRERLWALIKATPHLDWQLVTKRIGNAADMLPADFSAENYPNVWLVPTIVNQEEADRDIPKLFEIPAAIYGVSYEPALGAVDWRPWLHLRGLHWIIGGGESNQRGMRECRIEWLEDTARQCDDYGVAYFNKQIGAMPTYHGKPYPLPSRSKGDVPEEWPESIRIRQFPESAA